MTHPRQFDLICFDWDGTLFDSTAVITRCIQQVVVEMGGKRPSAAEAAYVIGMPLAAALQRVAPDIPREKYAALGARFRAYYVEQQGEIDLFDGALPLLRTLKGRHYRLAVATGKTRRGLDEVLASRELSGIFDDSRTADETAGKPDPRMLLELMHALDCPAARTLMIGDTSHDLLMARNAGCASVGVGYGAHRGEDLERLHACFVAGSVAELSRWLDEHA